MMFTEISISNEVIASIREEMERAKDRETGGPLVGCITPTKELNIIYAGGPGPRAILKKESVLIDGQYAGAFCRRKREATNANVDYIGDWHSHSDGALKPSPKDVAAMEIMQEHYPDKVLISLIVIDMPSEFALYRYKDGRFECLYSY